MLRTPNAPIASQGTLLKAALSEAIHVLERQNTPAARELRSQARSYEVALGGWATVPPTSEQLDAMFDLIGELRARLATDLCTDIACDTSERETVRVIPVASGRRT
jgi:hypothetical protein